MKHFKTTVAALAIAFGVSTTANAQLFGGLDNNTLLGGLTGAGAGAGLGAIIAPSGNNVEGAAIGALVGGLGGAAFGNQQSQFAGNPFAGQFNPGFNGRTLIGTGAGAALGGALGSNLAGSGNRQEGTAIGAVLGGAAGFALANQGQNRQQFGGQQFGGQQFVGQPQFVGQQFGGQPQFVGQQFGGQQFAQPVGYNPQTVYSGQSVTQTFQGPSTQYVQHLSTPQSVQYVPDVTVAAPNVRLAGPAIQERVIYSNRVHVEQMPIARAERYVEPPRIVYQSPHIQQQAYTVQQPTYQQPVYQQRHIVQQAAPANLCYAGSSKRYDSWGNEIRGGSCGR